MLLVRTLGAWGDSLVDDFDVVELLSGFRSVHALPMRLRRAIIGALNLFSSEAGAMAEDDVTAGQALADVATIAILQQRAIVESRVLNEQLDRALTSRVIIEQAKAWWRSGPG